MSEFASYPVPEHIQDLCKFLSMFTVNDAGAIIDNGKFEGEMLWVPLLWSWIDETEALDDGRFSIKPSWLDVFTMKIVAHSNGASRGVSQAASDLEDIKVVVFEESGDGFVSVHEYERV